MRKIFNKVLAGITSAALVATLLVGINVTKSVKADETVTLNAWTFVQGGQYVPSQGGNEGYIGSVTMNGTNEVIGGWLKGNGQEEAANNPSVNQTQTAKNAGATGFHINIEQTGWDADWANQYFNPWSVRAEMRDVEMKQGHIYTVSFKAHASKNKYAYVAFSCDVPDTPPYGEALVEGDKQVIAIGQTDRTYTYTFTNWVEATKFTTTLNMGAFMYAKDYAGNDVSDVINPTETSWSGDVYISDFTITDKGENPEYKKPPTPATTPSNNNNNNNNNNNGGNVNPPVNTTPQAPATVKKLAKVKKLKAVSKKKGTVKITWQKVKNAKTYQVKVGKKTYNTKKAKLTVKKVKKGKVVVKVRAKAAGFKTSAWATKKVKVK